MKLSVPYYSQFIDTQDSFWMLRACGATAMKSIGEFYGISMPTIVSLCEEARDRNGYHLENGWVHDYIVTRLKEAGLEVYRKEGMLDIEEITTSLLHNEPVIVSVEKRVLEQTRFHLIVLVGYEQAETNKNEDVLVTSYKLKANDFLYYHESESTSKERGEYRKCDVETFMKYWRGKAIYAKKN